MVEFIRTNDPVLLSWLVAALAGDGIAAVVLDRHASAVEGSISAIQRRVMVKDEDVARARRCIAEAEALARTEPREPSETPRG